MELVAVDCAYCGAEIHVYDEYVRENMYCTLGCLEHGTESGGKTDDARMPSILCR